MMDAERRGDAYRTTKDEECYPHYIFHILIRILIQRIRSKHLKPIPRPKPLEVIIPWQLRIDILLHPEGTRRLVRPSPRRVLNSISASADEDKWNVLGSYELNAVGVTEMGHVEWAEFVACKGVRTTLENDGLWAEAVEDFVNYLDRVVKQKIQTICY